MHDFEFLISKYFVLVGNQYGLIGEMTPNDFPISTKEKYLMKLFSSGVLVHEFKSIGEEIPSRKSSMKAKVRAFRTTDDISSILKKMNNLSIRGYRKF